MQSGGLRHSAAVDWLESGVHIKAVADLLGHSSIAITGDVYGHTSDDTARAAVDGAGRPARAMTGVPAWQATSGKGATPSASVDLAARLLGNR